MAALRRLLLPALLFGVFAAAPAHATFHFMQVEQVIGGVNGDISAQAIQLRMRAAGQNLMQNARVRVWDAAGANPILLVDPTTPVANSAGGARVLLATAAFANYCPVSPDFVMPNVIPASYLAAGSITFEDNFGTIYWRLSWGGAGYTGAGTMSSLNDANGNCNPPFAGALPHMGMQSVRFQGAFGALSVTNAADYALDNAPMITNNGGTSGPLNGLPGCSLVPGIDLYTTPAGGATYFDYAGTPIPAGFFGPGSDPFTGIVVLEGAPINISSPLGPTDTIVRRPTSALLPNPGDQTTVPIEMIAMSLVSVNPITVTYNGGQNPEQWNVSMCLSTTHPQQPGNMTVQSSVCGCPAGGTFDATLPVLPKFTFVRPLPLDTKTLDFGAEGIPPIVFNVPNGSWLGPDPGGTNLIAAPAGLSADHDCNTGTAAKTNLPPSTNFHAGLVAVRCDASGCAAPAFHRVRMTRMQAPFAAYGIVAAQNCVSGDTDGDGICDDADNCPALPNPLQQDSDGDAVGDVCDNCPATVNACQEDGNGNGQGDVCDVAAVGDGTPRRLISLSAPAPNPSNGTMRFSVSLEHAAEVRLAVYGVSGRLVRTIVARELAAGRHDLEWDARDDAGARVTSGAYYLRLDADGRQQARKLMVVR